MAEQMTPEEIQAAAHLAGVRTTERERASIAGGRRTGPFHLTGYPAISIPCGFSPDGLPLGLQIVARYFAEDVMFRVAHAYQRVTDWHRRRPTAVT